MKKGEIMANDAFEERVMARYETMPFVVVDEKYKKPRILGRFDTELEASEYISTLPGFEKGRYGIDKMEESY